MLPPPVGPSTNYAIGAGVVIIVLILTVLALAPAAH